MSFSRSSLTVRKVLTCLGCTEQMVPDQRLVLELGVSRLPKKPHPGWGFFVGWLQPPRGQQLADHYRQVTRSAMPLDMSRALCRTASARLIYNLYPRCYNITFAFGSLSTDLCRKWRARRGGGREWLKPRPSCLAQFPQLTFFKPQISLTTATSFHGFIFAPPPPQKKGKEKRVERFKISKSWWGCRTKAGISGPGFWDYCYASIFFLQMWFKGKFWHWLDYHGIHTYLNQKQAPALQLRTL